MHRTSPPTESSLTPSSTMPTTARGDTSPSAPPPTSSRPSGPETPTLRGIPASLPPSARTEGIHFGAAERRLPSLTDRERSLADDVDHEGSPADPDDDPRFQPGERLLKTYVIERQLGRGGMGAVYLAVDDVSGQKVAVKVLPAALAREKDIRERFIREARALASLDHPGIVPLITFAQEGDDRFLVMKYVAGEPLDRRLQRTGIVDGDEAARITAAICGALAYAHDHAVVHRDIKPNNILIDDAGRVVIVDFGIARSLEGNQRLTQTGMLMGTPQYMSPEQIGGRLVDGRADLYAAGLILFELLVGDPPFDGEKTFDILRAHVDRPPPDVAIARAGRNPMAAPIPHTLSDLCGALLQKDPEARPASGHDVIAILAGQQTLSLPMSAPTESGLDEAAPGQSSSSSSSSSSSLSLPPPSGSSKASTSASETAPQGRRIFAPGERPTTETPALPPSTDAFLKSAPSASPAPGSSAEMGFHDQPLTTFEGLTPPDNPARAWAVVLLALTVALGVGALLFGDEIQRQLARLVPEEPEAVAVEEDVDDRNFQLAVLQSRAQVAFEQNRLDDARVAVDTAIHLFGDAAPPGVRLLRAEILLAGQNKAEAKATVDAMTASQRSALTPEEQRRLKDVIADVVAKEAPRSSSPSEVKPAPRRRPASPPPPSRRSERELRTATRAGRYLVASCYERLVLAKKSSEKQSGQLVLKLRIAPEGHVRKIDIVRQTVGDKAFATCVTDIAREWVFPPFAGEDDTLEHTINFAPR